jgi:4-diphosphocytidyl-2-C-methyl-D-erythritol kinase
VKNLILKTPAKINLYLEVIAKRPDNYHDIKTVFEKINLYDEIWLRVLPSPQIKIICHHRDVPSGEKNLVYRATELLCRRFGIHCGLQIKIEKRIPVAAGLGGGSTNAAGLLLGINRFFKLGLGREELINCAAEIGADVPFFLQESSFAIGKGKGEKIEPVKKIKKKFWHILIVPQIKVSSRQMYARLDKIYNNRAAARYAKAGLTNPAPDIKILLQGLGKGDISLVREGLFNRLEAATFDLHPQVYRLKKQLQELGLEAVLMSGSGPAVFGLISSRKEGQELCKKLSRFRQWQKFLVCTV